MNLKPIERLTLAQAIYKVVAEAVSTENPDSMRSDIDAELIKAYELDGIKSRDLRLNGETVGTYTVRVKKAVTKDMPALRDLDAFKAWLEDNKEYAISYALLQPDFVSWVVSQGELPDGYDIEHIEFPEKATGTTLRVDVEKVSQAMGNELPSAVAGLLGGER